MALPYDTKNNQMIIEGFICPECQSDMSSVEMLQTHFELLHMQKNTNQNIANNTGSNNLLKDVFAKAKTLISATFDESEMNQNLQNKNVSFRKKLTPSIASMPNSFIPNSLLKELLSIEQHKGLINSHTVYFKQTRDQTIGRYVIQINKILITLDRLITFDLALMNSEAKRDEHYKSIVSWIQDSHVNLCPNCAKSFSIICRKHHCRLCGAIMCSSCSQFISLTLAKQLTDPSFFANTFDNQQLEFRLRRSESIASLNSYFFKTSSKSKEEKINNINKNSNNNTESSLQKFDKSQIYLRLCINCSTLLEKKYISCQNKITKPVFVAQYDELFTCISEVRRIIPIFTKMSESLNSGEAIYKLDNAEEMRSKLIKLFQQTETLSGLILNFAPDKVNQKLSNNNDKKQPSLVKDQLKLQRNIRAYVVNYIKENSYKLSQLPSREVYSVLKIQHQQLLQEQMKRNEKDMIIQKNKFEEFASHQRMSQKLHDLEYNQKNDDDVGLKISIDNSNGWAPNLKISRIQEGAAEDSDKEFECVQKNALKIQIKMVECYLEEALKQDKYEEANLLQKNLDELLDMQDK